MIITSINKKDDKCFKLYIDDIYYGLIYYGDIKKMSLIINKNLNDNDIEQLQKMFYKRAFNKAINLISKKEMCKHDIRTKLREKGYNNCVIEDVIDKLTLLAYIDEKRYSYFYVKSYISRRSIKSLYAELQMKGINLYNIEEAIAEVNNICYADCISIDKCNINNILDTKYRNLNRNNSKELNRMYNFMLRRGFSYEDVKNCLNKTNNL